MQKDLINLVENKDVILVGNSVEILQYNNGELIDSYDTVVGIRLINAHASSAITVDVAVENSSNDTELIKNAPIPNGSSLELIDGGSKIILKSGDKIEAKSNTASSLKAVVSYIDAIST